MSETLHIMLGGGEFEATPENTTLFTFLGKTAFLGIELDNDRYNHIFFQTGEEDDHTMSGTYLFRAEENANVWDTIATHLLTQEYPLVLNRRDVPTCDVEAYGRFMDQRAVKESQDLGDFIPEGWS